MRQAVRQTHPIPPRASAAYQGGVTRQIETETPVQLPAGRTQEQHWLTPLGCGALLVIGCVALWTLWIIPTYDTILSQWHYGDAHITRLTVNIGQGREDFVAYDQNGRVVVLEVNQVHPERTHLYTGINILNDEQGNKIIGLSLADVNHDGKMDIIVMVEEQRYVLFHHGTSFSWSEK